MKLFVCESCEAEFSIKHNMESRLYKIQHCPFCGEELNNEEMEDEIEFDDFDECEHNLKKQKVVDYNNGFVIY